MGQAMDEDDRWDDDGDTRADVVDADGVRICAAKCPTCIFRPGNLMHLNPGRVKAMVADCLTTDAYIPCHDTLHGAKQAICRGFYDAHGHRVTITQLAQRLGFLKEIP